MGGGCSEILKQDWAYSQCTDNVNLEFDTRRACGPSSPRCSWVSHLTSAPLSSLLMLSNKFTDSVTGVLVVLLKSCFPMVWLFLYHVTVRFWIGATLSISHCSSYSLPSTGVSMFKAYTITEAGLSVTANLTDIIHLPTSFLVFELFKIILTVQSYVKVFAAFNSVTQSDSALDFCVPLQFLQWQNTVTFVVLIIVYISNFPVYPIMVYIYESAIDSDRLVIFLYNNWRIQGERVGIRTVTAWICWKTNTFGFILFYTNVHYHSNTQRQIKLCMGLYYNK